jgi:hypothetical protein
MRNSFFLLLLLSISIAGHTHTEEDTVVYSMVKNKPNSPYFGLGLSYDLSINSHNMTLAAFGIDGTYLNELFSINIYSRMHLGERIADFSGNHPYATSVYEPEHSRDLGFLATFYFLNNTKRGERAITLAGNSTYEVVTYVPCDYTERYGIDAGYSAGVTYYNFQEDEAIEVLDMSGNSTTIGNQNEKSIASYYKYSYLKIGVSRTITNQVTINTDKFGQKSDNSTSALYIRGFIGLSGVLDNIYLPYDYTDPDSGPYTEYDLTPATFNRIGGCIGWSTYNLKKLGVGTMLELGLLPGPKTAITNNVYLDLKLRFHFAQYL